MGFGQCVEMPISRSPQTGLQRVKNGRQQRRASQRNRKRRRLATTMRPGTVCVSDPLVYESQSKYMENDSQDDQWDAPSPVRRPVRRDNEESGKRFGNRHRDSSRRGVPTIPERISDQLFPKGGCCNQRPLHFQSRNRQQPPITSVKAIFRQ